MSISFAVSMTSGFFLANVLAMQVPKKQLFSPCSTYSVNWNLGCVLITSAYFMITQINGMKAMAIKASKLFPHPYPNVLYNRLPARGNNAPPKLLSTVLAAMALAAYVVNAST